MRRGGAGRRALGLAFLLSACGLVEESPVQVQTSAITDGDQDSGHPSVGALLAGSPPNVRLCTATLIGRRTVLTAAHCLLPGERHEFRLAAARYLGERAVRHPGWDPDRSKAGDDLGLVVLVGEPSFPAAAMSGQVALVPGLPISLVGFGTTADGESDAGIKRVAQNAIDTVTADRFTFAGSGGGVGNVCEGDSGGPVFATVAQIEVVIGVVSGGVPPCGTLGWATRVDGYSHWIAANAGEAVLAGGAGPETLIGGCSVSRSAPRGAPWLLLLLLLLPLPLLLWIRGASSRTLRSRSSPSR